LEEFIVEAVLSVLDDAVLPAGLHDDSGPPGARLEAAAPPKPMTHNVAGVVGRPRAPQRAWPNLRFAEQREILKHVIESIVIGPAARGRRTAIEDRVTTGWKV
jgi:hypothetical protein